MLFVKLQDLCFPLVAMILLTYVQSQILLFLSLIKTYMDTIFMEKILQDSQIVVKNS